MTDDELWTALKACARRWALSDMRDYPALAAEKETTETLATDPPKQEKKAKASDGQRDDRLVDLFATHLAHSRGQPVAELRPYVQAQFEEAHQEYRAADVPYRESVEGFLKWLGELRRAVTAA